MQLFAEFKKFALKGNVIDLAVGVMIGAAFGKIVSSLVENLFMPVLSFLTAGVRVNDLSWTLFQATESLPAVEIKYGPFLQSVIDFTIIAFTIFLFLRLIGKSHKEEPKPTAEVQLLTEIRDLLRNK